MEPSLRRGFFRVQAQEGLREADSPAVPDVKPGLSGTRDAIAQRGWWADAKRPPPQQGPFGLLFHSC
jgi:hypothetical protein